MKDFCVYGCNSLVRAFIEEIESLGFVNHRNWDYDNIPLMIFVRNKIYNTGLSDQAQTDINFHLPQDWSTALEYCKNQNITINGWEAKVKDNYVHFGCVILHKQTLEEMSVLSSQTELKVAGESITSDTIYKLLNLLK